LEPHNFQCLEAVASRLDSVTARETDPLRRITGDAPSVLWCRGERHIRFGVS
jgi:hypothetical protein